MHDFLLVFYSDHWSRRNRCRVMSRQTSIHSLQREAGRRVEQISLRNAAATCIKILGLFLRKF